MADDNPGQPADDVPERNGPPQVDPGVAGRMRYQDHTTVPREPTLAERKARERALRQAEVEWERQQAAEKKARKTRKRVLIGAGATAGVAALIGIGYLLVQPDDEIDAQCVTDQGVVVDDSNCVTPATNTSYNHSGYYSGGGYYGGGYYPVFIGSGGSQYHYNYGGYGTIGSVVSGGTTTVPPAGTPVRTSSGSGFSTGATGGGGTSISRAGSGTVSRGGLGSSGSSGSSSSGRGSSSGS